MPRWRSSPWSPGWSPARTRSPTWICCATVEWVDCSPGCGHRRHWAVSCGCSASATHAITNSGIPRDALFVTTVRQLDAVAAALLARLAAATPVLPDADRRVLVDIDDTQLQTYGTPSSRAPDAATPASKG